MDLENFDLKASINLPKTTFPMKANLPQAEPKMLARWEAEDLYGQIRAGSEVSAKRTQMDGLV